MAQSKAHIAANNRYEKKAYDKISLRLRKDSDINGDIIRIHAETRGESVNSFLKRAVIETMQRDNAKTAEDKPNKEE